MKKLFAAFSLGVTIILQPLTTPVAVVVGAPSGADQADASATATPIKHFISLMQENHSFDNYFGTYPGADGIPDGTCMPVHNDSPGGDCVAPFPLKGRPVLSLGHNDTIHQMQYNNGAMDGFLSAFADQSGVKDLPMGYYDDSDIPYYWNVADQYVLFDRAFTSAAGGSVWNHFFWVSGSPGNPDADTLLPGGFDHVPTIFDRLEEAGVSWKFYVQNYDPNITYRNPGNGDRASQIIWVPLLNYNRFLDDPALREHIVPLDQYFTDVKNNALPAVSYIVPSGASEHPPGSIQAGMRSVRNMVNALMASSAWNDTAFMWTYDDWGGWYDHVPPPVVDRYGYGFRAPALLVSAYARKGHIDHTTIDFTSQLRFIEDNWGLPPLAERDATAANISSAFDFASGPRLPVILSETRGAVPPAPTSAAIVYVLYGAALIVPPIFLLATRTRRRTARRTALRSPS